MPDQILTTHNIRRGRAQYVTADKMSTTKYFTVDDFGKLAKQLMSFTYGKSVLHPEIGRLQRQVFRGRDRITVKKILKVLHSVLREFARDGDEEELVNGLGGYAPGANQEFAYRESLIEMSERISLEQEFEYFGPLPEDRLSAIRRFKGHVPSEILGRLIPTESCTEKLLPYLREANISEQQLPSLIWRSLLREDNLLLFKTLVKEYNLAPHLDERIRNRFLVTILDHDLCDPTNYELLMQLTNNCEDIENVYKFTNTSVLYAQFRMGLHQMSNILIWLKLGAKLTQDERRFLERNTSRMLLVWTVETLITLASPNAIHRLQKPGCMTGMLPNEILKGMICFLIHC